MQQEGRQCVEPAGWRQVLWSKGVLYSRAYPSDLMGTGHVWHLGWNSHHLSGALRWWAWQDLGGAVQCNEACAQRPHPTCDFKLVTTVTKVEETGEINFKRISHSSQYFNPSSI